MIKKTFWRESVCESLSALGTSSFEYVSAVGSLHSLSETMLFLSLSLFRLVCSEHYMHLLILLSEACCFESLLRFYTMTSYIISETYPFVKCFEEKISFLHDKIIFFPISA